MMRILFCLLGFGLGAYCFDTETREVVDGAWAKVTTAVRAEVVGPMKFEVVR